MHAVIEHSSAELYGSDRSLLSIVEAVTSHGGQVTVLLPNDGPLTAQLEKRGVAVEIRDLAVLRRQVARSPRAWWRLWRAYATAGTLAEVTSGAGIPPTVVLSNTSAMISGRKLAKAIGVPHVQITREIFQSVVERTLFGWLIARSDFCVFVSQAAMNQFGPATSERSQVIHSGADLTHTEWTPRSHPDGPVRLVCVGRLNAWKGQDTLLRAACRLKALGHDFRVRIVGGEYGGPGDVTNRLQALARELEVDDVVEFVGEVPDATPHFEWSDISIAPSRRAEPFGKVVIEAMNASRPVIATAAGGPAEILQDGKGGCLIAPDDSVALANAVIALADEETWTATSREAFVKSLKYSEASSADQIATILHDQGAKK